MSRALSSFVLLGAGLLALAGCDTQRGAIELGEEDLADTIANEDLDDLDAPEVSSPDTSDTRSDVGNDVPNDTSDTSVPDPVSAQTVYLATAGIDVPMFVPVDATGHGTAIALGPQRGAGYGLGEGQLQATWTTPDGAHHVVAVRHLDRHTSTLFVLDVRADAEPVRLGEVVDLTHEVIFSDDGRRMALVAGEHVYVTSALDEAAPSLTAIATIVAPDRVERLRWVAALDRVAFEVAPSPAEPQSTWLASAALDGSDVDTVLAVTLPDGSQQRIQAVLPDGRLVYSTQGVLYALSAGGTGQRVRLTPLDQTASVEHVLDGGDALLVELRDTPGQPRQIVRVSTDGQQADSPVSLLTDVVVFRSLLTDDGALVFRRAISDSQITLELLETFDGTAAPRLLTTPLARAPGAPWLVELVDDPRAVLVAADDQLLRIALDGDATTEPTVLFDADDLNWGLEGLTANGQRAVVWVDDPERTFMTVDVDSPGTPLALDTHGWHPRATPTGVIWHEPHTETGLFLLGRDGTPRGPIGGWQPGEPTEVHLLDPHGNATVVFRLDDPATQRGQWHRVHPFQFERIHATLAEPDIWSTWIGTHNGAHLLFDDQARLRVVGGGDDLLLSAPSATEWTWVPDAGIVVYASGSTLEAVRIDTGESWTVASLAPEAMVLAVTSVQRSGGADDIVAVTQSWTPSATELMVAPLDGSEADTPTRLTIDTGLLPYDLQGVPGTDRVLLSLASSDTSVPHPREVWSVDLASGATVSLNPPGADLTVSLWHPRQATSQWPDATGLDDAYLGSTTRDGAWVALDDGHTLFAARPDGSEIIELYDAGQAWLLPLTEPLALHPDDGTVLIDGGQSIAVATLGEADSGRVLSPAEVWLDDDTAVRSADGTAIHVVGDGGEAIGEGIWTLPLDGSGASQTAPAVSLTTPLGPGPLLVTPDGPLLVTCTGVTDRRLCQWDPAGPASLVEVTAPDDAIERTVGTVGRF